jgi:L-2-hydroxyglutarate oxidase
MDADLIVIGGGIVGLSTAMQALAQYPGLGVIVLEKESRIATHQTGHNSGVIHAGVYYQPGSLKAQFCREGAVATKQFCREHEIAFEACGKLLVATEPADLPRMDALYERAVANGISIEKWSQAEVAQAEPRIRSLGALYSPSTGIVDYTAVARAMAQQIRERGGAVLTSSEVTHIDEGPSGVRLEAGSVSLQARNVVAAAGLQSDRIARMCGLDLPLQIVPFRGEYYRLPPDKDAIIRHLIYPIPDPALPFLGVHLTKMSGGFVTVGPNAVLAFAREGYRFGTISPRDLKEMAQFAGFRKMVRTNLKTGVWELSNSLSKKRYLALCQRYCPELTIDDLLPYPAGVRAQAVMADGTLVHDFLIRETTRTLHVLNAPSPAATSALPIGRHIVQLAERHFGWSSATTRRTAVA